MDFKVERDSQGFIDLDKANLKAVVELDKRLYRFVYDGKDYYYKMTHELGEPYREIVACNIAELLKINHVDYDLAYFQNEVGVVSESFFKRGEHFDPLDEVLYDVDHEYNDLKDFNLMYVWDILSKKYKDKDLVYKMVNDIVDIFMLDLILHNYDRHGQNIGIIDGIDGPRITPAFDHGEMFSLRFSDGYGYSMNVEDPLQDENEVISKFVDISENSYVILFQKRVLKVLVNLDILFDNMFNKYNIESDNKFMLDLKRDLKENLENILKIIADNKSKSGRHI